MVGGKKAPEETTNVKYQVLSESDTLSRQVGKSTFYVHTLQGSAIQIVPCITFHANLQHVHPIEVLGRKLHPKISHLKLSSKHVRTLSISGIMYGLGTAMLFIGLIVSAKLIYEISLGHTMLLPSLCGFIAFGPLAFLCGALLCGITTYLVKGTFFLFGIPILLEGLSKCVFRNDLVQDLSETTLSFGNSVFFQVPKSILQSFIFEDATKFDSLSDINGLTLIKEQDKVKCMNEVATTIISVQTTVGKQPDLTCVFA